MGTALSLVTLGLYMMAKNSGHAIDDLNWIPLVSFSCVLFMANIAILTIPVLAISEVMPEKVKDFGLTLCMALLWIFSYITIKYLPFLTDVLDIHGTVFVFAAVCVCGAVFMFLFVPETKGRSYEEIMALLQ